MTDMKRVSIAIPHELDRRILALRRTDEFIRCSYSEIIRRIIERELDLSSGDDQLSSARKGHPKNADRRRMPETISTANQVQVAEKCFEKALLLLDGDAALSKDTIKAVSDLVRIANEAKCTQSDIAFFPG